MRRTLVVPLLLAIACLVAFGGARPAAAAFLPDLNEPGWAAYANVSGWTTNWRDRPEAQTFWEIKFDGTMYVNYQQGGIWCVDAVGAVYDINKRQVPNAVVQVQMRYIDQSQGVEVTRGFQPEGIWYGFRMRIDDRMDFTRDGIERSYSSRFTWGSGWGLSPVPFTPAAWQQPAKIDMRLSDYVYTPDGRDFNAQFTANPFRGRGVPTYSVTFNPTRRYRFPAQIAPQVEVYRQDDPTTPWQLFSRTTMTARGTGFSLPNLPVARDGNVFLRIILGNVNVVDSNAVSLGAPVEEMNMEAYWAPDCQPYINEFTIPPGRQATKMSVSIVTGWRPCAVSAQQAKTITWEIRAPGAPRAEAYGEIQWNGQEREDIPPSLGPGTYVLRITSGARSTTAHLRLELR